ncbi:MAG: Txe/YoeB family addiction module toxin [Pseudomonadota bacterium]
MIVKFTAEGIRDLGYWEATNPRLVSKINALISSIEATPFRGLGKPEPLKGDWRGWWSRRITEEHRLIYRIRAGPIEIARCRFHYKK